ncbi:hypothetical protein GH714_000836 [Hevea brasiliensis]|uniref:Pentacotripeptide-repeat region of PRORP domain-containing protein n=1 Tax=Hevea brasiliensis TaxID=3981 RepID=A0A6A6KHU8_HEVBR|nr:hypothetical protein GH714_000836 [Hevea brasiliensis]
MGNMDTSIRPEIFSRCSSFNGEQCVDVYNALLFALCEVRMFHGAYALIRRIIRKGLVPDKRTYMVLVNGWCSSGKLREAQQFLEEMINKGFNPSVRRRDLVIEGLLNAGIDEAFRLLYNAIEDGHRPFPSLYAPRIKGMCMRGQFDDAICFFGEMKICGSSQLFGLDLTPISRCYDMVIDGLKNCGKHDLEMYNIELKDDRSAAEYESWLILDSSGKNWGFVPNHRKESNRRKLCSLDEAGIDRFKSESRDWSVP